MINLNTYKNILVWVVGFVTVEAVSFLVHYLPDLVVPSFVVATFLFIALAVKNYQVAVMVALAEIFLGSHGHVLTLTSLGIPISIRVVVFIILFVLGIPKLYLNRGQYINLLKKDYLAQLLGALLVIVGVAFVHGLLRGYPFANIFFDGNNYLFFLFIVPVLVAFHRNQFFDDLIRLMILCAIYLSVKTLLLVYLFTNVFYQPFLPDLYVWLRDARLGEFTPTTTGAYRIFFQSQFFLFPVWWLILWKTRNNPVWFEFKNVSLLALISAALLVSFSRSFWLGWAVSGLVYGMWLLWRKDWITIIRTFVVTFLSLGLAFVLVWFTINFPIPIRKGSLNLDFVDRLNVSTEAAASSRWNLLGPLWSSVSDSFVFGKGLGASVTYISNDPRVREINETGEYTTTAFEWGYLDQWLELGIIGVLLYLAIGMNLGLRLLQSKDDRKVALALGLVALYVIHVGSPYLNHPLGITFILLLLILFWHDRYPRQSSQYS